MLPQVTVQGEAVRIIKRAMEARAEEEHRQALQREKEREQEAAVSVMDLGHWKVLGHVFIFSRMNGHVHFSVEISKAKFFSNLMQRPVPMCH
jgi:uncharacterized protein GlcG (DUF336 family)